MYIVTTYNAAFFKICIVWGMRLKCCTSLGGLKCQAKVGPGRISSQMM